MRALRLAGTTVLTVVTVVTVLRARPSRPRPGLGPSRVRVELGLGVRVGGRDSDTVTAASPASVGDAVHDSLHQRPGARVSESLACQVSESARPARRDSGDSDSDSEVAVVACSVFGEDIEKAQRRSCFPSRIIQS